jgi:hypothetical protein
MRRASSMGEVFSFGGRVPPTVGGLISAIVVASLLGALAPGLIVETALVPAYVWSGQVWRLVTWVFFESGPGAPLNLLFIGLTLFWLGRDLCYAWGPRRFLLTFLGIAAAASIVTCLLAIAWPPLMRGAWTGSWPATTALIVAWAMIFPERQMLAMLVLPITGRTLLWITVGGTVLYAIFGREYAYYVPHLSAQLLMIAYARGWSLRGFWQSLRIKQYERRARRRASHLKVVKKEDRWLN